MLFTNTTTGQTVELTITQDAYSTYVEGQPYSTAYEGMAKDEAGNEYRVVWQLQDDFNPHTDDDEGNACDWDSPWSVELISEAEKAEITTTDFDHNYHNSGKHYDNVANEEYVRHNVDIYNQISFKGVTLDAVYQTGQSYRHGNYSAPSACIELSEDGGTSEALIEFDSLSEYDIDNMTDEDVKEYNEKYSFIESKDDIYRMCNVLSDNLKHAENYFNGLDIKPIFINE